jgi:hypothetical protein
MIRIHIIAVAPSGCRDMIIQGPGPILLPSVSGGLKIYRIGRFENALSKV